VKIAEQDIKKLKGLSEVEALSRLKESGYNELPSSKKRGIINIIIEVFCEPMFLLLVACGTLYLILGDVGEALMLLGFVFVIIGITIYQENKTEKALDALKDLASPRALVIREGSEKRIAGREVVADDLIIIKEGDRVPVDAILIWGMNLTSDESLLTGESVPVRKNLSQAEQEIQRPGGDDLPFVYSGSLIVQGKVLPKYYRPVSIRKSEKSEKPSMVS
jgi:Ca2+-transporting ATPase